MFNFRGGGLDFKSDVAYKQGTKIRIQFDNPPFQSGPKALSSVVRRCRELTDYDSDYTFGVGVKFIWKPGNTFVGNQTVKGQTWMQ